MTDRELLELAAKAAGIVIEDWTGDTPRVVEMFRGHLPNYNEWNPLTDDGDRYRLAQKLGLSIDFAEKTVWKRTPTGNFVQAFWGEISTGPGDTPDDEAHAIVRAAASLAKEQQI